LKAANLNVRSLLPKIDEVRYILHKTDIDILGVNETWLDSSIEDNIISIDGFNLFRHDRDRHGGGVCIYVRDTLQCKRITNTHNIESVWLDVGKGTDKYFIGSMYRPPSAGPTYYDCILDELEDICRKDDHVILLGDLNFNYKLNEDLGSNPLHYIETAFDMQQLILEPTRVTSTSSSIIDIILTTKPSCHTESGSIDLSISDHKLVYTIIGPLSKKNSQKHNVIKYRDFKSFNKENFLFELGQSLSGITVKNTADSSAQLEDDWNSFKETFLNQCDKHAPIKVQRLKNRMNPWINRCIIKMMYKRDFVKAKADRLNDARLYQEYKELRNLINVSIRREKKKYFESEFYKCQNNVKHKAKLINKIMDKHHRTSIPSDISPDCFNEYFSNIGMATASKLSPNKSVELKSQPSLYDFHFQSVTIESVDKQLTSLGEDSSSNDVLNFDSKLLCISHNLVSPFVTYFINASLNLGVVLSDWKLSRVTPIYKGKGDIHDKGNYRPISVISHISKLLEKQVQKQLILFLTDHNLLSIFQSAYRKYHGTITSLHKVIEDWIDNFCDKLYTGICFLDISKCFDTIDHNLLLQKLKFYGIKGIQLRWFTSYLHDRSQVVSCHNSISSKSTINIGVPQGSVLGPVLFLLFANDLPDNVHLGTCNMFADDTVVYISGNNHEEVQNRLQECIDDAAGWYSKNNLLLNSKKSNSMIIHPARDKYKQKLKIDIYGESIEHIERTDYLGVSIDNTLTWKAQISKLCKALGSKIAHLKYLRASANKQILLYIYNTHIQPIIDYGITIWGCAPKVEINRIQRLQNMCARIILGNFDFNKRGIDLVRELNWMNVSERIHYFTCILMYKCLHEKVPTYLQNEISLKRDINNRQGLRTSPYDIYIPPFLSSFNENSIFIRGAKSWNALPLELQSASSIYTFKSLYKKNFKMYFIHDK
jgi:hypothetical protein